LKTLSILTIKNYAEAKRIISTDLNKEYQLYILLANVFTIDRPDLLPNLRTFFTMEGLSKLVMGTSLRYDKNVIGTAINTRDTFFPRELGRIYSAVMNLINDKGLRDLALDAITVYSKYVTRLSKIDLTAPFYRGKRLLYGFGWYNPTLITTRLQHLSSETYNLDALTGNLVINGVAHHITYDKSETREEFLIYLDRDTNLNIIRDPPKQLYFGQPIDFSNHPGAIEDMNTLLAAKKALKKGVHPAHWGDKSHRFYNPDAILMFYWANVNVQKNGINWLLTGYNIPIPTNFRPQEYLAAL